MDTLVLLTRLDARSSKDVIDGLQKAVTAGERSGRVLERFLTGDLPGVPGISSD
ncbi:MAG TPA: hypothetical protein VGI45_32910 [Terracidiphilus sp.]